MVVDYITNKIRLPPCEQHRPLALPDVQLILDRDDIDKRISDHHEAFKNITYKSPLDEGSLRHLAIKMGLWHSRLIKLEEKG